MNHDDLMRKLNKTLNEIKNSDKMGKKDFEIFKKELSDTLGISDKKVVNTDLIMDMVNLNNIDIGYLLQCNNKFHADSGKKFNKILKGQEVMLAITHIKGILKVQGGQKSLIGSLLNKGIIKDQTSYIFYDELLEGIKKVSENTPLFHEELIEILEQKIFDKNTLIELERMCDSILFYIHYNTQMNIDNQFSSLEDYMKHFKKKISSSIVSN